MQNQIVDVNKFVTHPGFSTISETILAHLDPETLANCRLVSKPWKHFTDTSKKVLLVQVEQLMNNDMQIPGNECYEVESIIEKWPRYQRVLNFMKTKVPLEGIRF